MKILKCRFKKLVAVVLLITNVAMFFSGCGTRKDDDGILNILCTVFPVYDWVREITKGADNIEVELLVDSGVDMHSYQPAAADIVKIASCDLFIYVGGASESWVEDVLKSTSAVDRSVLRLMDCLTDDMKICTDKHNHSESHLHENTDKYDEHVWLSLINASVFCSDIYRKIVEIDPMSREQCLINKMDYTDALKELHFYYSDMFDKLPNETLVFGGRFPFAYLLDDFDIKHYAAFEGCSAESEASFETVVFLAGAIDDLGVSSVMTVKGDSDSIAKTIIQNTKTKNQQIIALDSMQSVTRKDIDGGATYFTIMQDNLDAIKVALDY